MLKAANSLGSRMFSCGSQLLCLKRNNGNAETRGESQQSRQANGALALAASLTLAQRYDR